MKVRLDYHGACFLSDVICIMDFHPVCLCFFPSHCMDDMLLTFILRVFKLTILFLLFFKLVELTCEVLTWLVRKKRVFARQPSLMLRVITLPSEKLLGLQFRRASHTEMKGLVYIIQVLLQSSVSVLIFDSFLSVSAQPFSVYLSVTGI